MHKMQGVGEMENRRTLENLKATYVGESKAIVRNRLFAEIADSEGYEQIARLFRAVAEAESVHAKNALEILGEMKKTEENLRFAFENEIRAKSEYYPKFIREAEADGNSKASLVFSRARDVEERHGQLYRRALDSMISEERIVYHVCSVCGYVAETEPPDHCPICMARREHFKKIA
jgi:rubrerythrin